MLPVIDLPEYLDPAAARRCYERRLRSERLLYLALCPEKDRQLIEDKTKKWNLGDFKRITNILDALEMSLFSNYLQMKHSDLLEQAAKEIQSEIDNHVCDIDKSIKEVVMWHSDFCQQLPSETIKKYISELLYID